MSTQISELWPDRRLLTSPKSSEHSNSRTRPLLSPAPRPPPRSSCRSEVSLSLRLPPSHSYLQITDESLNTPLLVVGLPTAELCALVVPHLLLHVEHEPGVLQLEVINPAGDHQHLEVRVFFLRQSRCVETDLEIETSTQMAR